MTTDRQRHYGEGTVFQRSSDGLWIARMEIGLGPDGCRRRWQAASRTRRGALESLRAARLHRSEGRPNEGSAWTVAGWLRHWLESIAQPAVRPTTWRDYETAIRRHLIPALGPIRLADLMTDDVRRMHRNVTASVSLVTANKAHRVLRAALSDALNDGLVPRNVAARLRTPALPSTRTPLTAGQAAAVIAATADDPLGSRWAAALLTGTPSWRLQLRKWVQEWVQSPVASSTNTAETCCSATLFEWVAGGSNPEPTD